MTDKILYEWKQLNVEGEVHALYMVLTGLVIGYVVKNRFAGVYKVWHGEIPLGEYISLESAKTVMDDIMGRTTLQ